MVNRFYSVIFTSVAVIALTVSASQHSTGQQQEQNTTPASSHQQHTTSSQSGGHGQAHTNRERSRKTCSYGMYGKHCEHECGVTLFETDLRIVGGLQAIPHSWPAQVFIETAYMTDFVVPDNDDDEVDEIDEIDDGLASSKITETREGDSTAQHLYLDNKAYGVFMCGGTLIRPNVVLTAGHCILETITKTVNNKTYFIQVQPNQYYPSLNDMYTVFLGYHNVSGALHGNGTTGDKMAQIRRVKQIIRHPKFDNMTLLNDLALLILDQDAELNQEVQVACLPSLRAKKYPNNDPSIKHVYAVGWGLRNEEDMETPDNLYNVKLDLYNGSYCDAEMSDFPKNWNKQICAGNYLGGEDTCSGDSGGGLYVLDSVKVNNVTTKKFITAGIVSYGHGCARVGEPGIYTKVSYYLDWIYRQIKPYEL